MKFISVVPEQGGPGGPLAPPPPPQYLSDQLHNPIRTGESRLSPPITTGTPLPAALHLRVFM